jgi:hypothetical protein
MAGKIQELQKIITNKWVELNVEQLSGDPKNINSLDLKNYVF